MLGKLGDLLGTGDKSKKKRDKGKKYKAKTMKEYGVEEEGVQDFGRVLLKDLAKLNSDDPPFCNVTFVVGPEGTEQEFQSVKAILALQSEMFGGMLFGGMAESTEEHPTLVFPDFNPQVFRIFLNFLHTGKLVVDRESADIELVMTELMTMADHFDVRHLFGALYSFQEREYNDDNVMTFLHLGERFRDDVLIEDATAYIMKHGESFFSRTEFVNPMPAERLCDFLQRDDLRAKELTLLNAVVSWGEFQVAESKDELDFADVSKEPLSYIRYGLIPAVTLMRELYPAGLIDSETLLQALAFQADSKNFKEEFGQDRRRGVLHSGKVSLSKEEIMRVTATMSYPTAFGSTHDGGATICAGKLFAHYGNDGTQGNRLHVIDLETGDTNMIDLPFPTHGAYPVTDESEFVYIIEDSDNAHGSGFGRVNVDTMDFERLADAPAQHLRYSNGCYQDGRVWKAISGNSIVSYAPETDTWNTHNRVSASCHLIADPTNEDLIWILEQGGSLRQYSISGDSIISVSSRPSGFGLGANNPTLIVAREADEKSDEDGVFIIAYGSSVWNMYDSVLQSWETISWVNMGEGGHVCVDSATRKIYLQTNNTTTWNCYDYSIE